MLTIATVMTALTSCKNDSYRETTGLTLSAGATLVPSTSPYQSAPGGEFQLHFSKIDGKFVEYDRLGLASGIARVSPGQHLIAVSVTAYSFLSRDYAGIMVTPVIVTAGQTYHVQIGKVAAAGDDGFVVTAWIADTEGVRVCEPLEVNVLAFNGSDSVPIFLPGRK